MGFNSAFKGLNPDCTARSPITIPTELQLLPALTVLEIIKRENAPERIL